MDEQTGPRRVTRRRLVAAVAAGTVAIAGCSDGDQGENETNTSNDTDTGNDTGSNDTDAGNDTGSNDTDTGNDTGSNDTGARNGTGGVDGSSVPVLADSATVPVLGDPEAGVTLEVYEDFLCPHCKRYNANFLGSIESTYIAPGDIRYEQRTFPVVDRRHSFAAANAAYAVLDEGGNAAFWEYKSRLFARQREIPDGAPGIYAEMATAIGVDGEGIESAAVERTYDNLVMRDLSRGQSLGVRATPSFVVNGTRVPRQRGEGLGGIVDRVTDRLDTAVGGNDNTSGSGTRY